MNVSARPEFFNFRHMIHRYVLHYILKICSEITCDLACLFLRFHRSRFGYIVAIYIVAVYIIAIYIVTIL